MSQNVKPEDQGKRHGHKKGEQSDPQSDLDKTQELGGGTSTDESTDPQEHRVSYKDLTPDQRQAVDGKIGEIFAVLDSGGVTVTADQKKTCVMALKDAIRILLDRYKLPTDKVGDYVQETRSIYQAITAREASFAKLPRPIAQINDEGLFKAFAILDTAQVSDPKDLDHMIDAVLEIIKVEKAGVENSAYAEIFDS